MFWAVENRSERPEGVSWETLRTGEFCHVDGLDVSVLVRDLRSDAILMLCLVVLLVKILLKQLITL